MVIDSVSLPSVSTKAELIDTDVLPLKLVETGDATDRVGASATARTETARFEVVMAELPPKNSVALALTTRLRLPCTLAGRERVRPVRSAGVRFQVPAGPSTPWLSVVPAGTPLIVIDSDSLPSVSRSDALMCEPRSMAVSSLPEAGVTDRLGASATALTTTDRPCGPLMAWPAGGPTSSAMA